MAPFSASSPRPARNRRTRTKLVASGVSTPAPSTRRVVINYDGLLPSRTSATNASSLNVSAAAPSRSFAALLYKFRSSTNLSFASEEEGIAGRNSNGNRTDNNEKMSPPASSWDGAIASPAAGEPFFATSLTKAQTAPRHYKT